MSIEAKRVVFLGVGGVFTHIPFRALVGANLPYTMRALIIPHSAARGAPRWLHPTPPPKTKLPVIFSPVAPNAIHLATQTGIPILEVGALDHANALAILNQLKPDLIITACFPSKLPEDWLNSPSMGCINLHPSRLPAYRGPAPLFWQARANEPHPGVSLHFMDNGFDTGDIIAQTEVHYPDGIGTPEAEQIAATALGQLLLNALKLPALPRTPQPAEGASYQSNPSPADKRIVASQWSAQHVFRFIRMASAWAPFEVEAGGETFEVSEAVGFDTDGSLAAPYQQRDRALWVECQQGVVRLAV